MTSHCTIGEMATAAPYTQVYPNLFMGAKTALKHRDEGDFDVYVSMAVEAEPPRSIRGDFTSYHIKLYDVPWDFASRPEEVVELVNIAKELAMMVKSGDRVLIFCQMGMNRSGLMAALTLMQLGYSWRKALRVVKQRHGCAMSNPSFVDVLPFAQRIMARSR